MLADELAHARAAASGMRDGERDSAIGRRRRHALALEPALQPLDDAPQRQIVLLFMVILTYDGVVFGLTRRGRRPFQDLLAWLVARTAGSE